MGAIVLNDKDDETEKHAYKMKTVGGGVSEGGSYLPGANPGRRAVSKSVSGDGAAVAAATAVKTPLLLSKTSKLTAESQSVHTSAGGVASASEPPFKSTPGSDVSLSAKPPGTASVSSSSSSLALVSSLVGARGFPNREYSLALRDEVWTDFVDSFDQPASGSSISLTVWIYVDPKSANENEMRTILANRKTGCDRTAEGHGFSLYVNTWDTNDRAVNVEFGTATEGCSKLATPAGTVPAGRWTQVGLILTQLSTSPEPSQVRDAIGVEVSITIDGEVRAHRVFKRGNTRSSQHMRVGAHLDGLGHFAGNISELVIWSRSILDPTKTRTTPDTQGRIVAGNAPLQGDERGLLAYYPLDWSGVDQGNAGRKLRSKAEDVGLHHHEAAAVLLPKILPHGGLGGVSGDSTLVSSLNSADLAHLSSDVASSMNWSPKELAAGTYPDHVSEALMASSNDISKKRALAVKAAMQHSWNGYKRRAWGFDELKPQSGRGQNNWGGMGVTLLDSLDTLWLMGMKDEFDEAAEWCATKLNFNIGRTVSTFETTIRSLGGLLSAYDISGNKMFLDKALDLGNRLFKAFNTPSGIPMGQVNLQTGAGHNAAWTSSASVLSEIGTLQVEFRYLAEVTGNQEMFTKATKVFETVRKSNAMPDGLAPIYVSPQTGKFTTSRVTFGALGDSWYEYLLKCWLQGGKTEPWLRDMYDKSMDGMINKLLKRSHPSNLAYVSDWDGSRNVDKMDHLVCFLPGILALGAYTKPDSPNRDRDMMVAKSLMYTCYQMYERTTTGIAPEYVDFPQGSDLKPASRAPFYILRPETAESLFVLHQITVSTESILCLYFCGQNFLWEIAVLL